MKKIIMTAMVLIAAIILIQACTKKEEMPKEKSLNLYSSTTPDPVEAKIIKFIDRMDLVREDPNYPGSTDWNYSEDSTIWYIEAALNYENSQSLRNYSNDEEYYQSHIDSSVTSITSGENGDYGIVSIQVAYDQMSDSLSCFYNSILNDKKFFVIDDVLGIEESTLRMRFVFGEVNSQYSIGDWYWGWSLGMCSGSQIGIDAADVMEQAVNGPYPPNPNAYSPFDYYTNVSTTVRIEPINVPVSNNPYGNYMLFQDYQEDILNHHCLNTPEMGKFIGYLPQIAATYQPSGKDVLFYQVVDDTVFGIVPGTNKDFWYMIHWTKVTYGIHHTGITPPPTS